MKNKKILYWVLIAFFSIVIVVSAFFIIRYFVDSHRAQQEHALHASIRESILATATDPVPTAPSTEPTDSTDPTISTEDVTEPSVPETTAPTEPPEILPEMRYFYDINNDLVGWITIADTRINYPVVQSPYEANFYLHRDLYKEYEYRGTIYVREACNVFKPSDNLTLYGHAMGDMTMFGDLHYMKSRDYYEEHKYIQFDTLYEHHKYEIIAVFNTVATYGKGFAYHLFDDAKDEAAFNNFINTCKELSFYDTGVTAKYGDKLITLSTCDQSITDGRLVVVAKRIS